MASVVSQLIEEVIAHVQSDTLEDAREICADGTYFPNNLRRKHYVPKACIGIQDKWIYYFRNDLHSQTSKCLSCEENNNNNNNKSFKQK